jgi:hypothetical protein
MAAKHASARKENKEIRAWMFDERKLIDLTPIPLNQMIPPNLFMHGGLYRYGPSTTEMTLAEALDKIRVNRKGNAVVAHIPEWLAQKYKRPSGEHAYYVFRPVTLPSDPVQEYRACGCIWSPGT